MVHKILSRALYFPTQDNQPVDELYQALSRDLKEEIAGWLPDLPNALDSWPDTN